MGLPYRGPTERAQFQIDSFGYILYFLCKCSRATYDFNFGVTPSHQQRVVGENSLLFCSGAANWIFAQLQIASLMKACHCQAGPEWVNVINFLFCDPRPRRSPKMWNSLCFGKSYFGLMQQEQVADMERRFCIRLDAKLTLIELPLDADALVDFYKLTKTPADKNAKCCLLVQIRFILVLTRMRASRLKTKLKSGLCHPHPQLCHLCQLCHPHPQLARDSHLEKLGE